MTRRCGRCFRTPIAHWSGSNATATPTATGSSNTPARPSTAWPTRAGRTHGTGVNFADGRIAQPPIALAEVSGYNYAAYLARGRLAQEAGDTDGAQRWSGKARQLKEDFNEAFWLPKHGWFAAGLDRDKQPIDALTSNIGHCLWTGIADQGKATQVAEHLLSDEMFSGWGIRTLATSMACYNPMSYHNGSVWPHDNAICASGLIHYGFVEHAQQVATAILDAATHFGHRRCSACRVPTR